MLVTTRIGPPGPSFEAGVGVFTSNKLLVPDLPSACAVSVRPPPAAGMVTEAIPTPLTMASEVGLTDPPLILRAAVPL